MPRTSHFCSRSARCVAAALLLSAAPGAFAYLDPGTGSMIIQGIIAGVAMAGVTLKLYWRRFLSLFGGDTPEPAEPAVDPAAEPDERG